MVDLDRIHQRLELLAGVSSTTGWRGGSVVSPGCGIDSWESMTRSTTPGYTRRWLPVCLTSTRLPLHWLGSQLEAGAPTFEFLVRIGDEIRSVLYGSFARGPDARS